MKDLFEIWDLLVTLSVCVYRKPCSSKTGLLWVILSVIFMKGGVVRDSESGSLIFLGSSAEPSGPWVRTATLSLVWSHRVGLCFVLQVLSGTS